jgi:hypothetical protein
LAGQGRYLTQERKASRSTRRLSSPSAHTHTHGHTDTHTHLHGQHAVFDWTVLGCSTSPFSHNKMTASALGNVTSEERERQPPFHSGATSFGSIEQNVRRPLPPQRLTRRCDEQNKHSRGGRGRCCTRGAERCFFGNSSLGTGGWGFAKSPLLACVSCVCVCVREAPWRCRGHAMVTRGKALTLPSAIGQR